MMALGAAEGVVGSSVSSSWFSAISSSPGVEQGTCSSLMLAAPSLAFRRLCGQGANLIFSLKRISIMQVISDSEDLS